MICAEETMLIRHTGPHALYGTMSVGGLGVPEKSSGDCARTGGHRALQPPFYYKRARCVTACGGNFDRKQHGAAQRSIGSGAPLMDVETMTCSVLQRGWRRCADRGNIDASNLAVYAKLRDLAGVFWGYKVCQKATKIWLVTAARTSLAR
jgi:hypothetical protein